jgi:IS1 family transposase
MHDNKKYVCFHLSKNKTIDDLDKFVSQLPQVEAVYSDKNPVYKKYYGEKNIAKKGIMTNLVESVNSQLRGYCSRLIRKAKSYAKSVNALNDNLCSVFINKIIKTI